jgi:poly(3-hydroxybutyrate) depolymerase
MNYMTYELAHTVLAPMRWGAHGLKVQMSSPFNPFRSLLVPRMIAAGCEVFESVTRRYGKPEFGIKETRVGGIPVPVREEVVLRKTFCHLLHFDRDESEIGKRYDPKVLLIAPMSGHYATLLRGTVEAMIREHNVYITDWLDARTVPASQGPFDLDDFIDYLIEFIQFLGPNTHVIAVCQPSVPALAAAAVMAKRGDPLAPASLTLMGGPIDTRRNPTVVNNLAAEKPIEWFKRNVISHVPFPNAGFMRPVYPGFIQLSGFMQMNLDRHVTAHRKLFNHLVKGDCDSVQQHRDFYEEYLAVMDLPAEFYLQTVKTVFQDHLLPDGKMMHRGEPVDCKTITKTALMTVEGERDDICGLGQTEAAQDLCTNIPVDEKYHYVQPGVGHYGVFNGTRWRTEIQPRIREFIRTIQFKRRIGTQSMRMSLPYRGLKDEREEIVEYKAPRQPNGAA